MKTKRNLSGIYFRSKNEAGKWDSICFEDLNEIEQDNQMKERTTEWLTSLTKQLANTLNEIGEQLDIIKE